MAEKPKPQDDLSIEEILGSIRRIIAEDEDADADVKREPALSDDEGEDDEPLELTNKIDTDGTIVHTPIDEPTMEAPSTDVIDLDLSDAPAVAEIAIAEEPVAEIQIAEPIAAPKENIAIIAEEPKPMSTENAVPENLLSPSASIATAAVMAKLARQAAINEDGNVGVTLEAMVKEMLKPMLKEWLDSNLPELVQKMVERELDRLTKRL